VTGENCMYNENLKMCTDKMLWSDCEGLARQGI
jgi:hypothetical protein